MSGNSWFAVEITIRFGIHASFSTKFLTNKRNCLLGETSTIPFETRIQSRAWRSRSITINRDFLVDIATLAYEKGGIAVLLKTRMRIHFHSSLESPPSFLVSWA